MKNLKLFVLFFIVFFLSSCGSESVENSEKVLRKPVQEKVSRTSSQERVLRNSNLLKKSAKKVEERTSNIVYFDALLESFGFSAGNEVFLGERPYKSLITERREIDSYELQNPIRMSQFLSDNYLENESGEDVYQKHIMGTSYNVRDGYLLTAKYDDKNVQKGYIESTQKEKKKDDFFEGQKGYIESYDGDKSKTSGNYLDNVKGETTILKGYIENTKANNVSKNYLENFSEESFNYGENYLEVLNKNDGISAPSKGYLSFLNNEAGLSKGYLESYDFDGFRSTSGYIENTDYVSASNSYLDRVYFYGGSTSYLDNVGVSSSSKGYIESLAVKNSWPNMGYFGF